MFKNTFYALIFLSIGIAGAMAVSGAFYPLTFTSMSPVNGQRIFNENCSGCHNNVENGVTKFGPDLHNIGSTAATRVLGLNASEYILESMIDPDAYSPEGWETKMPSGTIEGLTQKEVRDLVSYLLSRGSTSGITEVLELEIPRQVSTSGFSISSPDTKILKKGWKLFSEDLGCAGCHSIYDEPGGGFLAPPLHKAYLLSREYLIESIRSPSAVIAAGYQYLSATDSSGEQISARVLSSNETTYTLMLRDENRHLYTRIVKRDELSNVNFIRQSTMPAFDLSEEDEFALISLLKFLRGKV